MSSARAGADTAPDLQVNLVDSAGSADALWDNAFAASERGRRIAASVAERAADIDRGEAGTRELLNTLAHEGLLDLSDEREQGEVIATLATECMTAAFSTWAHRMVLEYLTRAEAASSAQGLREEIAQVRNLGSTAMASGLKALSGVEPLKLTGHRMTDGVQVNGMITWASNLVGSALIVAPVDLGEGERIVVAFRLDDEGVNPRHVRGLLTRTEQLGGQTVAIPYWWSLHNIALQRVLDAAGLTVAAPGGAPGPRQVRLVVMPPAEMVQALAGRSIAGFVVADPFSAVAEARGIGRVHRFLGDVWKDHACCAVTVRQGLIDQRPEAAQGLVDGVVQAQQWIEANRSQMGAALTGDDGFLPQPAPAVAKVFTRTQTQYASVNRHPDWHGERIGFSAYPAASYTEALVNQMRSTVVDGDRSFLTGLTGAAAHEQLVDARFVERALAGRTDVPVVRSRQELIQP